MARKVIEGKADVSVLVVHSDIEIFNISVINAAALGLSYYRQLR